MVAALAALAALAILAGPVQDDESLRAEFNQRVEGRWAEIGDLLFSSAEADFIRGVKRLREGTYTNEHLEEKRAASLIAFRRARVKGWTEGYDAAESLILAYYPRPHTPASTFLETVKDLLKGDPSPRSRKTLRLVAVLECDEDPEFLDEIAKDPRPAYRSVALHFLVNYGGPEAHRRIADFLKDEDAQIRRSALTRLVDRKAAEFSSEIVALFDDAHCRDVVISAIGMLKLQAHAQKLVEVLKSGDPDQEARRYGAYHALRSLDPTPVIEEITGLLGHKNANVRLDAVRLLGHWRVQSRESVIRGSLRDDNALVREAAVEALVALSAQNSGEALAKRLEDPILEVRNRAAVALGCLNQTDAADRIVAALKAGTIVPGAAAEALLRMTPPARTDAIEEILDAMAREPFREQFGDCIVDERKKCIGFRELLPLACERAPYSSMVALMKRLPEYPVPNRHPFLDAISSRGRPELVDVLEKEGLLESQDTLAAALSVYGRLLTEKTLPAYFDLVRRLDSKHRRFLSHFVRGFTDAYAPFADDKDPAVRRIVLQALSQDPDRKHMARYLKYAEDPDPSIRVEFARNAQFLATTEHHEALGRLLLDPDAAVVWDATHAVSFLRLKQFSARLAELAKDEKHRIAATSALARLGAREHSELLVPSLSIPDSAPYAAQWIALMGDPARVPDLLRAVEKGEPRLRVEALKAATLLGGPIPNLEELLNDKDDAVRAAAATSAGLLRKQDLVGKLASMLKDPSHHVKAAAIRSLTDFKAREHVPAILEILELGRMAEDEKVRSRFFAEDGPQQAVKAASEALGRLGSAETARELGRHWRRSRGTAFAAILEPALLRLDARKYLAPILAGYGEEYGQNVVQIMNEVGAPRMSESLKNLPPSPPWNSEYGTLDRLALRMSAASGFKVTVSPQVPDEVKNRPGLIRNSGHVRKEGIRSIESSAWPECVLVYDEAAGSILLTTSGEAKRFWLDWAQVKK